MYCSKCGNEIKDGSLFCDKCGNKVEMPQEAKEPETTTQEVVEEVTPKQEGVTEDRLDEILSMLDEKEEKVEEPVEEKVEEKTEEVETPVVEETKEEVSQDRLDEILGMLDEKEESKEEEQIVEEPVQPQETVVQESTPVVEPQPVQQTIIQEPVATTIVPEANRVATEVVSKPVTQKVEEPKAPEAKSNSPLGLISMIIGIACIPLAFFIKLWTIPVAIVGIIVGACHKGKDNKKTAGIALSAASIPIAVIVAIVAGIFGLVGGLFNLAGDAIKEEIKTQTQTEIETKSLVYKGDGFTFNYNSNWSIVKNDDGDYLDYKDQGDYLVPVEIISLVDEDGADDVSTKEGRNSFYSYLLDYWIQEYEGTNVTVKGDTNFKYLKDDLYYATYTYEDKDNNRKGHYIIIASKDNNSVLTMVTSCSTMEPEELMDEVEIVLKTLEMEK